MNKLRRRSSEGKALRSRWLMTIQILKEYTGFHLVELGGIIFRPSVQKKGGEGKVESTEEKTKKNHHHLFAKFSVKFIGKYFFPLASFSAFLLLLLLYYHQAIIFISPVFFWIVGGVIKLWGDNLCKLRKRTVCSYFSEKFLIWHFNLMMNLGRCGGQT